MGTASNTFIDQQAADGGSELATILVRDLNFSYPNLDGSPAALVVQGMCIELAAGSRCLLIGANGAGKTTLLKVLAGKHMVPEGAVQILGRPPFHDTNLTTSGDLSYIGGTWQRDIAFAGYSVPLSGDFPVSKMISSVRGVTEERKQRLIKVLDVDVDWRMHKVSDGQRRRVQLLMGLLYPFKVLLLDEITVDLDVLGRADLMAFLKDECESRKATIIYATHIFDGLEDWPTHIAYLAAGKMQSLVPVDQVPELQGGDLLGMVVRLLRSGVPQQQGAGYEGLESKLQWTDEDEGKGGDFSYVFNNGWVPGTLNTSLKLSTNAVMRT